MSQDDSDKRIIIVGDQSNDEMDCGKTEEALWKSEERYRTLFSSMSEGFALCEIICDKNGAPYDFRYLEANNASEKQSGLRPSDVVGKTARELFPNLEQYWLDIYGSVALSGVPAHFQNCHRDTGRCYQIFAFRPAPMQFAVLFTDITEMKRTEEALRASEANYRAIFDAANDAIFIHDMETGAILDVNRKMTEMYGYTVDEVRQIDVGTLSSGEPPYTQSDALRLMDAAKRTPQLFEWKAKDKAGRMFWVEVNFRRASIGGNDRLLAIVRDISDRKEAETALRESEEHLRLATEAARVGTWRWDMVSDSIVWDDFMKHLVGVPRDTNNLSFTSVRELIHPEDREQVERAVNRAVQEGADYEEEYRIIRTDGYVRWVHSRARVIRDRQGNAIKMMGVAMDITDRKECELRREEMLDREHHIAEVLQQALVPPEVPAEMGGYRFAVQYKPARREAEVGGDFYDIFDLGNGKIGILLGDVVGKGLPAAIRVAAARYTIRGYAYLDPRPGRVLELANNSLCLDQTEEGSELSAFFGVLDTGIGVITYAAAGHEPPVLVDVDGNTKELTSKGILLSVMSGFAYSETSRRLNPGDRIVMVTDGITEARSEDVELFGRSRLIDYIRQNRKATLQELADGLLEAATRHAGGSLQDDAALVVIEQVM